MSRSASPEVKRARNAWKTMRRLCSDPSLKDYPRYGGAGIRVCPQWVGSFEQFLRDIGLPPTPTHWLGRLDTGAHYTPDNTVWTTREEQQNRRRYCRRVVVEGEEFTAAEASRLPGMPSRNTVLRRWHAGFNLSAPKPRKLYRASQWITHQGVTLPLPEWAERLGIERRLLWERLRRGMPLDRALSSNHLTARKASSDAPQP